MGDEYLEQLITQIKLELDNKYPDFIDTNTMIDKQALLEYAIWTDKPYTRVCLFENTAFELILICWNPNAQTAIHDHDDQNCRVFFLDGPFQETIYCVNGKNTLQTNHIDPGSTSRMKKGRLCHSLKNASDRKAMTLHLYNEPIKSCRVRKSSKDVPMEKTLLVNDFVVEYAI